MLGSLLKRAAPLRRAIAAPRRALTTRSTLSAKKTTVATKPTLALAAAPKRVLSTAVTSPHMDEAVAQEEQSGLLGRGYQLYPMIGLGLAAAVTQEWLIFDEYWITGLCYGGVMYSAYLFGADELKKRGVANFTKLSAQTRAAFGVRLDTLNRYKAMEDFALSASDELRALYAQEAKVNAMSVEYRNLKLKFDTRTAVMSKLNAIKVLEDDARAQAITALSKKAGEYVTSAYASAPAAVKQKNIDSGIAAIAPELSTRSVALSRAKPPAPLAADDPVKLLFDEFLATPRTLAELGVENYASKMLAKDQKH